RPPAGQPLARQAQRVPDPRRSGLVGLVRRWALSRGQPPPSPAASRAVSPKGITPPATLPCSPATPKGGGSGEPHHRQDGEPPARQAAAGGRRTPHALTSPVGLRHVVILAAGRSTKATAGLPPPTPKRASAVADGHAAARCAASPGVPGPPAEQREGCDDDLRGPP